MKPGRSSHQGSKGRSGDQEVKSDPVKAEDKQVEQSREQGNQGGAWKGKHNNFKGGNRRDRDQGGRGDRGNHRNDRDNKDHQSNSGGKTFYNNDLKDDRDNNREHSYEVEKKFTGRCRLFVGNLPNDTSEDDFREFFKPFGETSEFYINTQRGFGFVRLDTRQNAENAKAALDGQTKKGRVLRVRFATHGAALKVKHLGPFVSNEMLEEAFVQFGTLERAIVIVDDKGKPTGEGIVEFARKPGATAAINRINDGVFLIGTSSRPIVVEVLVQKDEEDGLPEKFIDRNPQYQKEKETGIRFASPNSFDYDFAQKWKELYRMEEEKKEQLKRHMEEQYSKLELDMGQAHIEHQAMLLRQDYLRKQEELKRMEEMHQQEVQRRLDMRRNEDEMTRRQDMMRQQQEEEMRRRQMEARSRAGRNEMGGYGGPPEGRPRGGDMRDRNAAPVPPPPAPPAGLGIDRPRREERGQDMGGNQGMGPRGNMGGGGGGGNMGGQPGGPNSMGNMGPGAAQPAMVMYYIDIVDAHSVTLVICSLYKDRLCCILMWCPSKSPHCWSSNTAEVN
jgi:proline- and glutamine-rich splicing factor